MTQNTWLTIYLTTITLQGALAGFVISHLLNEIKALHARINDIYDILLER